MDLHLYEKYSKKYHKKARLGITLKTYLLSIKTFSIYTKLMGKDAFFCPEVNNFFSKKQVSDWLIFKDIPRAYIFNYIAAGRLLSDTQFKEYFLDTPVPDYIDKKEFLTFTEDPASRLLKDLIQNKHLENLDYYKNLVKIINGKQTPFSLSEIYYLLCFCTAFSKEELSALISDIEFSYHYNNLKENAEYELLLLMFLIGNSDIKDKEKDLKLILRRFDKLSFDGKFIITALLYIYRY